MLMINITINFISKMLHSYLVNRRSSNISTLEEQKQFLIEYPIVSQSALDIMSINIEDVKSIVPESISSSILSVNMLNYTCNIITRIILISSIMSQDSTSDVKNILDDKLTDVLIDYIVNYVDSMKNTLPADYVSAVIKKVDSTVNESDYMLNSIWSMIKRRAKISS